jgi:lysophospholipase L1-like esterase
MFFSYRFQILRQIIAPMIGAAKTITKVSRCTNGFVVIILLSVFCEASLPAFALNRQSLDESIKRQAIEDPDGVMHNFYQTLRRADEGLGVARILHYGDSHVAADILTGALRGKLQRRFGDAGTGFVLAGKPWHWYTRNGVNSKASEGWRVEGLGRSALTADGEFGLAGLSLTTARANQWLHLQAVCSRFDVYLMKQATGGAIDVVLDGQIYERISLQSKTAEPFYVKVEAEEVGTHTLEIRTVTPGAVKVFGIAIETDNAGVVYDGLGINGARAYQLLDWDWRILASNLERRAPNLIIIAYGSNDVGDADLDLIVYGEKFSHLLNKLHEAAPDAALLVIAPPDRASLLNGKWQTMARMPGLVATQRKAALHSGAAFWNLFQAMGGAGAIERWHKNSLAQKDRVHLTTAGYKLAAELLYAELLRGYLAVLQKEKER